MYSQNTPIKVTPSQQKRIDSLFTPEKIIEYSKGLSNEKALREYVKELESVLSSKDSLIQEMLQKEEKYIQQEKESLKKERNFLDKISSLNTQLSSAYERIDELSNRQLDIQKSKSNNGVYVLGEFGNGYTIQEGLVRLDYKHVFFGLQYVRSKIIFGIKINPVNEEMIYAGSISFKLF